ncbi:50S ribosomal protein L11 methyltransferase [Rubrimonas cliftonensis]|uniref:Ribosomal protein L11 methyltransferase n=1 Tax=Rubrimonas cliftonensis TaxID=89524 RepID=A0A1H3Z2G0_9RHOB|nr:50S ribosomal protein L11 methyltransferase [Rubrimonas cliftonensis]SEA17638.1 [LSU ribosomal protein L11P]-lysine N-methyltransferase [Rubrimonas cliftonensis]
MTTWTALTTLGDRAHAEALGEALEAVRPAAAGVGVFEIEDGSGRWEVGGYFTEKPDDVTLALLAAAHGAAPFAVSKLPDTDWVAHVRRELSPVEAGRITVHGPHDPAPSAPTIALVIEAAMAFGTGHHATTVGCLLALQDLARIAPRPRRAADVGCGTGVLAMAAAKIWRVPVVASDIDPVATSTARANARANVVGPWLRIVTAPGFRHPALGRGPRFDVICANILARPLRRLAPQMAARCAPGGHVVLSGLLTRQAPAVQASYRAHGFARVARRRIGEWTTLTLRRL